MEPGAVTPGNPEPEPAPAEKPSGFNGARGCNPWKHGGLAWCRYRDSRFNGARGCNPWKQGLEVGVEEIFDQASMEPGAVTPGNSSTPGCACRTWHGFNGARGCNPWKLRMAYLSGFGILQLQWSQGL